MSLVIKRSKSWKGITLKEKRRHHSWPKNTTFAQEHWAIFYVSSDKNKNDLDALYQLSFLSFYAFPLNYALEIPLLHYPL
jgi:hypothetical protein